MRKKALKISVFLAAGLTALCGIVFFLLIHPRKTIAPILLYHSISRPEENPGIPAISKELFSRQMEYLQNSHYEPVHLKTLIDTFKSGKPVPSNWVVLTFDDGFKDFYSTAYPVLKKYGFKATLFVAPGLIGKFDKYLTWEQLRVISEDGLIEIGSHALMHSPLICLSPEEAGKRIRISKSILEERLGKSVSVFAYPYGALNYDIRKMVEESGYSGAAGTVYPRGQFKIKDPYNLRRVYVSGFSKYPLVFRFMLSGYYVPVRGLALRLLNIKAQRDVGDCVYIM